MQFGHELNQSEPVRRVQVRVRAELNVRFSSEFREKSISMCMKNLW
jgi:hypothetical protein